MMLASALVPRGASARVGAACCLECAVARVGALTLDELSRADCGEPEVLAAALATLGVTAEQAEDKLGFKRGNPRFCLGVALARNYVADDKLTPDAAWSKAKTAAPEMLAQLFPKASSAPGAWRRPVIAGVGIFATVLLAAHFLAKV